ncbi:hypothetical protein B0H14DRAFT_2159448, partial [Mycena olivaceomarginata]
CRTGHGHLGEYYSRFVLSEDVDCTCGEAFQSHEHVLCEFVAHHFALIVQMVN